jgi:hypothetical protein
MAELTANTNVIYCASRNPYDENPLRGVDAFKNLEEAFPDICLKSHWDPALLANRYLLPPTEGSLPTDYRPFTKICTNYFTGDRGSGLGGDGVARNPNLMGGRASRDMPYADYARTVDNESDLQGLTRPLTKFCDNQKYVPASPKTLSQQMEAEFPERKTMTIYEERLLGDVNRPKATISKGPFECRVGEDCRNKEVSMRLFNNPTKYDRQEKARNAAAQNQQPRMDAYSEPLNTKYSHQGR